jgi:hypothetical protein
MLKDGPIACAAGTLPMALLGLIDFLAGAVRNLLMVPSGTRRLKATAQEVSVNKD